MTVRDPDIFIGWYRIFVRNRVPIMRKSEEMLRERERKGLVISLSLRLIVLIVTVIGHFFAHHSIGEIIRISIITSVFVIFNTISLLKVTRGEFLGGAGITGLATDVFIMVFLPYNWYLSVGWYQKVPATYLLKANLPIMTFIIIALNTLAIRPLYPLIISLVFDVIWGFFLILFFNDPRTVYTSSFIDNFFSPAIMPSSYITVAIVITGTGIILSYLTQSYRKLLADAVSFEVQNTQLGRYFSPGVLKSIKDDDSIFQARKADVAVMFTDIRDFTAMSENLSPVMIVKLLREYHTRMVEIIYSYGGTIDKFLGDGIMVTFGTPAESPDDCSRALNCALDMNSMLESWNIERRSVGCSAIRQGIGLHYGEAVTGNIGSEDRLEYTVIGDTVNLASRIEGKCRETGISLLMSDVFSEMIRGEFLFREVDVVTVKGKAEPVRLLTVAGKE